MAAAILVTDLLERLDPFGKRHGGIGAVLLAATFLLLGAITGIRLIRQDAPVSAPLPIDPSQLGITPREAEVLAAIADGLATKEIARRLGISPNTVKTHSARLYEKLGAARRTEAVARARTLGLLP